MSGLFDGVDESIMCSGCWREYRLPDNALGPTCYLRAFVGLGPKPIPQFPSLWELDDEEKLNEPPHDDAAGGGA